MYTSFHVFINHIRVTYQSHLLGPLVVTLPLYLMCLGTSRGEGRGRGVGGWKEEGFPLVIVLKVVLDTTHVTEFGY